MTATTEEATDNWATRLAARFAPPPKTYATPGDLARRLNPKTVQTEALDVIDAALVWAATTPDARLIICLSPQEGKSVRAGGDFPTWLLQRNPDLRIVAASYGQQLATRNGRAIRARLVAHPELGLRIAADNGAAGEWTIAGRAGGVFSVGVGGGLTGRPADFLIIDDPIKNLEEAESEAYRQSVWDWWQAVASTRLAPGAGVVLILTRWHDDDLAGRLLRDAAADPDAEQWRVVNIPAQADHNPDAGETDPLGRAPGEWLRSARGRSVKQWEAIRKRVGPRVFASLYQGRPAPTSGNIFPADAWDGPTDETGTPARRYTDPFWLEQPDGSLYVPAADPTGPEPPATLIQSWDLTFKDTAASDYVVGQVWLRRGAHAYLLDQVRDRLDFPATLNAFRALSARWPQALLKLVEDKANGPALIASLSASVPGIVPVEPRGSKVARARAVQPLVLAGNVHLPAQQVALFDPRELVAEAERFPTGAHDDQVDALTQALDRLYLDPSATAVVEEDVVDAVELLGDDHGYLGAF